MLKKTITYTDYNGVERKEDFYFNFSKAEVVEMEMQTSGGLVETIEKIVNSQDQRAIIDIFKDLVLKAYGEKSPDGKHFLKFDENGNPLSKKFAQTEAYSILFMELAFDADAAAKFFNAVIPKNLDVDQKANLKKLPE